MKRTKKLLAGIIAATMMLSMSTTAFAEPGSAQPAGDTITIYKNYSVSEGTAAPDESFTFDVVLDSHANVGGTPVTTLPTVTAADYNGTTEKMALTVTLPEYGNVGEYIYKISEKAGNTAGVTYDEKAIYLKVTVVREDGALKCYTAVHKGEAAGAKVAADDSSFENTYTAGTLNVKKTVTGNMGDQTKEFTFNVKFTNPEGKVVNSDVSANIAGTVDDDFTYAGASDEDGYTFQLAHDETAIFSNLPAGVTYVVTEAEANEDGYETTYDNEEGIITEGSQNVIVTNEKGSDEIDTGINMDSMPYILIFAGVVVIAAVMIVRRRRIDD